MNINTLSVLGLMAALTAGVFVDQDTPVTA